jgi:lipoprotein-anchoring transpeptidase ErfK/SrfK
MKTKKFYLIGLVLAIIFAAGILFLSGNQFLDKFSYGCGIPSPEANGEYEEGERMAIFNNKTVNFQMPKLVSSEKELGQEGAVLGIQNDERWIEVDLSEQKLRAWEGNNLVYEFLISSGKWAPTPKGEFRIWVKLKYTKMEGGRRGTRTYYYLPNVPYTQYFYKGYGLHGTYWHNNFGQPMSHGCVNLSIPDAEKLFYWTSPVVPAGKNIAYPSKDNPGTRVIIHD